MDPNAFQIQGNFQQNFGNFPPGGNMIPIQMENEYGQLETHFVTPQQFYEQQVLFL